MSAMLLVGLLTCEVRTLQEPPHVNPGDLIPEPVKTVSLNSVSEGTFVVALDSLRTRFCTCDGWGPCYDYDLLYVLVDGCGVTAFRLREIIFFENKGDFLPNDCINATQSSVLTTTKERHRKVYLQEHFWSIVGTEVGTGEAVEIPLRDVASFQQHWANGF